MRLDEAKELAQRLMAVHDLNGWRFEYSQSKRFLGRCYYNIKCVVLSAPFVKINDVAIVEDTINHEIAHALAGHKAGHGSVWKAVAIFLGCRPETHCSTEVIRPPYKWIGTCPSCGVQVKRYRRSYSNACVKCCNGSYQKQFQFEWLLNPEWRE